MPAWYAILWVLFSSSFIPLGCCRPPSCVIHSWNCSSVTPTQSASQIAIRVSATVTHRRPPMPDAWAVIAQGISGDIIVSDGSVGYVAGSHNNWERPLASLSAVGMRVKSTANRGPDGVPHLSTGCSVTVVTPCTCGGSATGLRRMCGGSCGCAARLPPAKRGTSGRRRLLGCAFSASGSGTHTYGGFSH
ncbi:hypothetical protein B0H10DRAFT_2043992 [Mycena sp. CBHHK59/15]|nr:hypothetical protein B0H10DRAFT_2043992 [Mycena sp. CBHHK59/15]